MGLYKIMWVHSGTKDYLHLTAGCVAASIISMLINMFVFRELYFKIDICAVIMISIGIIGLRMSVRCVNNLYMGHITSGNNRKRLMIVGAGSSATIVLKDIDNNVNLNYDVVCFIDDDPEKNKSIIHGVRVMGTRNDIKRIAAENAIDEIMIALPSAEFKDRKEIIEICNETDCKVKILPSIDQMIDQSGTHGKIRDVQIEDLLERDPIKLDNSKIKNYIEDKVILVTGGGGSIGSELCRQIMRFGPKKLVVLDIYENNAYDLQMELNRRYPDNKPDVVIASVRDVDRIDDIFRRYRPYIVFHAAAHKHVPLMEDSPGEAIKNNVFGTLNVVKCSDKYGVKRFVMISTDKAVNPTNVMGATKRICEMIVQCAQNSSKTEFVAVRFGNVLGSNGSVIPLFKKQIEEGGPVTVTDKRITRFFMTITEAA
ncbi:MAG: polysaccharide biosynthesis protein, partial [Candidatus Ornithomonoglobus sp.]